VLADVVRGASDVLAPTAAKKGLTMRSTVDAELPAAIVGDAGRLRQILLNLLSNAVKFTSTGEVSLMVTGRPEPAPGAADRWTIVAEVRDTGMGIPADRIGRLFQSFTQADASIARQFGGTGLGLAISRRLAELMGGTLVAESAGLPGQGSTFRLTIPVDATASPDDGRPGATPRVAVDATALGQRRILLAEDNPVNVKLALRLLERMGYGADVASDGREAIDALERAEYDVVLMDVQMPGLDGLDATRAIRTRWPDRPLHIVAMTANAMEGDRETCLAAGMDDYVSKPIRPDELARALAATTPRPEPTPGPELAV
jgi:CheY-like chemotaxis protein